MEAGTEYSASVRALRFIHVYTYAYEWLITSAKKVMYSPMSISWLVCQQEYAKTTEWVSMKSEWRMGLSPQWTPFTVGG